MYIDEKEMRGHELLCSMQDRLSTLQQLDLIEKLSPELSKDGNQFCYLYGQLPNDCVVGFGDTVALAMSDFYNNFYNSKAVSNIKRK